MDDRQSRGERFEVLDGIRGAAALMVSAMHFNASYNFRIFTNTYLAVDVFFVLSGFVISYAYAAKLRAGMSGAEFMARRVGRLFPMTATGVLLGMISLLVLQSHGLTALAPADIAWSTSANLLFLPYFASADVVNADPEIGGLLFPGNLPLWSIFYEMTASVAFIFLCRLKVSALLVLLGIILPLLFLPAYALHPGWDFQLAMNFGLIQFTFLLGFLRVFAGFVGGMLIYRFWSLRHSSVEKALPLAFRSYIWPLAVLMFVLTCPWPLKGLPGMALLLIAIPLVVAWGAFCHPGGDIIRSVLRFAGWLSFPIYCLHWPIMKIFQTEGLSAGILQTWPGSIGLLGAVLAFATTISIASLFDRIGLQRRLTQILLAAVSRVKGMAQAV